MPILVNTRMEGRIADGLAGQAPDVTRDGVLYHDAGVDATLIDRGLFPANPLAKLHLFFAGIDPLRAIRVMTMGRRVDAVLCVFENTALALLLFRRIFRFKAPIVLREVSPRGWRPRDVVLDYVMPRVDLVVGLTPAQCEVARTRWRLRRPPELIDWPVDEIFYQPRRHDPGSYILAVGEDASRDFETLISACAEIDVELVLKTSLRIAVPDAMRHRVRIISKRLSGREFRDLYAGARVVAVPLRPSDNPGGISSLLEAMAMGRPVVASDAGVPRHVLTPGIDGLIVPPADSRALRQALLSLLGDDARARLLGTAARATIERRFALPVVTRQMAALLRRAAGVAPWPATLSSRD